MRGRDTRFDVRSSDFAVLNQAFTGAANELDLTGGRFTPVHASKVPDYRGLRLSSGVAVALKEEVLSLQRTEPGAGTSGHPRLSLPGASRKSVDPAHVPLTVR
ncbi:hypothetical protein [Phycicoccus sp. Soil803]|uniref:hypothetical protein n=1 Tax=Phycicoccus sp. Soil803 TaxID=1736415 RepID=UPI000702B850|nr:hypothetical protein [Phycicoccus sp. Soil803]KRF26306.1 hypothetical protein ASG95_19015 [Phycicoccus sp. Soil803]KRF29157.1 hypothetical protein ASG91_06085 [Phycicoccus sp. Soil802]